MKKINGEAALEHYTNFDKHTGEIIQAKNPEYITMSRRPGIAKNWYEQFKKDVYPSDEIIINGRQVRPPKFYDSLYEIDDPVSHLLLKTKRQLEALKNADNNTPSRLLVKETICKAHLSKKPRELHNDT